MPSKRRVSRFTKYMYAVGDIPFSTTVTLIGFFLMIFMTNSIGISAFWAGFIIFVGIIWDAAIDPFIGYFNDHTVSKLGRRRKYLLLFFFPSAIAFLMLFSVPTLVRDGSEFVKIILTLFLYLLFSAFSSLAAIPYSSIVMDITNDYDERTSMMTYRMISSIIGSLLAVVVPEFLGLSNASQANSAAYFSMGAVFMGFTIVFGYIAAFNLKEKKKEIAAGHQKLNLKKFFVDSWKNKSFREVGLMYMFSIIAINFIQGNLVYFLNYKMLMPGLFLPIAGGVMILAVILMPIWTYISKKTNKKTAYIYSIIVISIALLTLTFAPPFDYASAGVTVHQATPSMLKEGFKDLQVFFIADVNTEYGQVFRVLLTHSPWVIASAILLSFGFAGLQMLPFSMVPDAINFVEEAKENNEGTYFGVIIFTQQLGWAFGMLLTGSILSMTGYVEPAKVFTSDAQNTTLLGQIVLQSEASVIGITLLFSILPILFCFFGGWAIYKHTINRQTFESLIAKREEEIEHVTA